MLNRDRTREVITKLGLSKIFFARKYVSFS